jgi:hypothetical protein
MRRIVGHKQACNPSCVFIYCQHQQSKQSKGAIMVRYEVNGCLKTAEIDDFEHGCQPETASLYHIDVSLLAESIPALVAKIHDFIGSRPGSEILDACDEQGRLDVQVMETDAGNPATDSDLDAWQEGKRQLWLCDYSFRVEQVGRATVWLDPINAAHAA